MVGNLEEWVADRVPRSTFLCASGIWGSFGATNAECLVGDTFAEAPAALFRGGSSFDLLGDAGVFAVDGHLAPATGDSNHIGFRAAR